jgi:hypothetical protein
MELFNRSSARWTALISTALAGREHTLQEKRTYVAALKALQQAARTRVQRERERAVTLTRALKCVDEQIRVLEGGAQQADGTVCELAELRERHAVLEEQTFAQMLHVDELVTRYTMDEYIVAAHLHLLRSWEAAVQAARQHYIALDEAEVARATAQELT